MLKSRLSGRIILGLAAVVTLAIATVSAVTMYCQSQPPAGPKPRVEQLDNGVVVFDAAIDSQTASSLIEILRHPRVPIAKLGLNSYGGFGAASNRIATVLQQRLNIPVWVPANGVCESACIEILAASPDTLEIAPTAKLMFHAAAGRASLSDCWICRQLNRGSVWLTMHFPWYNNQAMLPWARAISPNLPVLFELCPLNPLETQVGITISGDEMNGLRAGTLQPEQLTHLCPSSRE